MSLNGSLIRILRHEHQLSTTHAAAIAGISPVALTRVEDDDPRAATMLSVEGLIALATALGARPVDLIRSDEAPLISETDASDDAAILAGLLLSAGTQVVRSAVADALGWTNERARTAVDMLDTHLSGTGLMLHRNGYYLRLVPAHRATVEDAKLRLVTRKQVKRGMDATTVKTLRLIYEGRLASGGRKGAHRRAALHVLTRTGAITKGSGDTYTISEAMRYALGEI
jgi:transcriptional regulator with XRE-family HTH domain